MSISPEKKESLLIATREAAAAFLEDMAHIRGVLAKQDQAARSIRLLSGILRRLMIDNDLRAIAPPRVGQISFVAPDNSAVYQASRKQPLSIYVSGGISVFNCACRAIVGGIGREFILDAKFDRTATVLLPLDGFLSQKVLALDNHWVSRRQVIKYVANVACGVHSSSSKTGEEIILARLRQYIKLTAGAGGAKISVNDSAYLDTSGSLPFVWSPESIDFVLLELLSAAHFLAISPDINALEWVILAELRS
jgi:hypothetical protein